MPPSDQGHHSGIDHQQEQTESGDGHGQGEHDGDRPDDGVDDAEQEAGQNQGRGAVDSDTLHPD